MVATATKPRQSSIVDDLQYRQIDANLFEVESRSTTLGSHFVRRDGRGELHCDRACTGYNVFYRCSHVASVLRGEREAAEAKQESPKPAAPINPEWDFCCGCYGPAGDMLNCSCMCHPDPEPLPAPDVTNGVPYFPLADVPMKRKPQLEDFYEA